MNSKQKGSLFERHCAAILRAELWPTCYTSRFMGSAWDDYHGVDLTGTGNFNVQCKALERTPPYHTILKQKMPQGKKTNIVIHKRDNSGIIVAMALEDFIRLLKNGSKY